ncbi:MAG: cysteine desulfurase family protein [Clostridia bacterium]
MENRTYLDYSATTPIRKEVAAAMLQSMEELIGNPSSLHSEGRIAKRALQKAREQVAKLLGCEAHQLFFCSGGTEANNLAVLGACSSWQGKHAILSTIEHPSVRDLATEIKRLGGEVDFLSVNEQGIVELEKLATLIKKNTVIVSVMLVNNETGCIQPVEAIAKIAKQAGVLCHSDGVQAAGKLSINVQELAVDLLSISSHKFYGPKGVGVLYVGPNVVLQPRQIGGGQERRVRSGTENLVGIVGCGVAAELAEQEMVLEKKRITSLQQLLQQNLQALIVDGKIQLNSTDVQAFPWICSFSVLAEDNGLLLRKLDMLGFAVSSGSACSEGEAKNSHVLVAMRKKQKEIEGVIRVSLGKYLTAGQIITFCQTLRGLLQ